MPVTTPHNLKFRALMSAEADAEDEDETPLFMTKPPTKKNAALDALAAIIDDDDDVEAAPAAAAAGGGGRRRKRGIGEVQVTLALTSVDDCGVEQSRSRRQRMDEDDSRESESGSKVRRTIDGTREH